MRVVFEDFIYREDKYRGEVEVYVEVIANVTFDKGEPEEYEVVIESVNVSDSRAYDEGEDITLSLDPSEIDWFEDRAIEVYNEEMENHEKF